MFGKRPPSAPPADRIRLVAERKASAPGSRAANAPAAQRAERTPVFRQGLLLLENGERLQVAIKNLSHDGARIEFFQNTVLPAKVELVESTLKLRTRATIVWQAPGAAGLKFER
jgi:hypothetical protein